MLYIKIYSVVYIYNKTQYIYIYICGINTYICIINLINTYI